MQNLAGIELPEPRLDSPTSIESALRRRRSVREFLSRPVTLAQVSQLLWAAQGLTGNEGRRTAPSAGALYPLELLVVAGNPGELPAGIYRYRPVLTTWCWSTKATGAALGLSRLGAGMGGASPADPRHHGGFRSHGAQVRPARPPLCGHGSRSRRSKHPFAGRRPGLGNGGGGRV